MIVITMTDCPIGLRGDLTKWLLEVSAGAFVGQVRARVRDQGNHKRRQGNNGV